MGKRLKKIKSMVATGYDHIWDCCCDHGLLGGALLSMNAAPNIHFVDIVPALMSELENKLSCFFSDGSNSASQWQVHCVNVSELPLQKFNGKHLVIIAGVGGNLMTEFVQTIHQKNPNAEINFLLCPVHNQFRLRKKLIQLNFSLLNEILMTENQRDYEILLLSNKPNLNLTISSVGSLIWQAHTPEQLSIAARYLSKTLAHYQRMQLHDDSDVRHILDAYTAINLELT